MRRIHVDVEADKDVGIVNDPSEGSPTETLLRLLLPLNYEIQISFVQTKIMVSLKIADQLKCPEFSLSNSIGRSDGRCVQKAGT